MGIRRFVFTAAIVAGASWAATASAATLSYTETTNTGTLTTFPPGTASTVTSPFGTVHIDQLGPSNWVLTFHPTSDFKATSTNPTFGQLFAGTIDFTLNFDVPVVLLATAHEGGAFSNTGAGFAQAFLSGSLTTLDPGNVGTDLENNGNPTFAGTGGPWSSSISLATPGTFSSYHFSFTNDLFAFSPDGGQSSTIDKESFSVSININPTPLPSAASSGLAALGALGLTAGISRLRKKAT